jgi:hypothetical protein
MAFDAATFVAGLPTWNAAADLGVAAQPVPLIIGTESTGKTTLANYLASTILALENVYTPQSDATPTSSVGAPPTLQEVLDVQSAAKAPSMCGYVRETVIGGHTASDNAAFVTVLTNGAPATHVRVVATAQTPIELPRGLARGAAVIVLLMPMASQLYVREAFSRWPMLGIPSQWALRDVIAALPQYTALVVNPTTGAVSTYSAPAPSS